MREGMCPMRLRAWRKFESSERSGNRSASPLARAPRLVPSDAVVGIVLIAAGADRLADALTMSRPDAVAAVTHEGHLAPANGRDDRQEPR